MVGLLTIARMSLQGRPLSFARTHPNKSKYFSQFDLSSAQNKG
jgi:hypothetical protein